MSLPSSDLATATADKIKSLDELAVIVAELQSSGKRVVHCHGVFDLLHVGHIRHFEQAKQFGERLIVTLTPDQWVNKGVHRPAFPHDLRAEVLASLGCVDYVAFNRWPTAIETIAFLKPNVFAKGSEFRDKSKDVTGAIQREADAIQSVGGEMVFTEDIIFSSSTLINRHLPTFPPEASGFLTDITQHRGVETVLKYLDAARSLKVLVLGETILDEYHYCETLGKAGKDPILAVRWKSAEKFAGGVLAAANHVAGFCDRVDLLSFLGQNDPQETFVREQLQSHVAPTFFQIPNAPTIVKRRFIESYPFQKMFEVDVLNDHDPEAPDIRLFHERLAATLPDYDVVIVTDYGHGMLTPKTIDLLCGGAKCLAINTQVNAGNQGFNTISKYRRADFVCVSEYELRLDARERRQELTQIVEQVAARLGCRRVMVTRGSRGIVCYDPAAGFLEAPALASHFTDRVGAGEAVFAVASLCMVQDAPADILGLIGNAVGAMAVSVVGNRSSIDKTALKRFLISVLK